MSIAHRHVSAPCGPEIPCRGGSQQAALRTLMHSRDPEVAERPDDRTIDGGARRAALRGVTCQARGVMDQEIAASLRQTGDPCDPRVSINEHVEAMPSRDDRTAAAFESGHTPVRSGGRTARGVHSRLRDSRPGTSARGSATVSVHQPGGIGIGRSNHAGSAAVANSTSEADAKLERVLTCDPGRGVGLHAGAGCREAVALAAGAHSEKPMGMAGGVGR